MSKVTAFDRTIVVTVRTCQIEVAEILRSRTASLGEQFKPEFFIDRDVIRA
jgi:hypothetical protein